MTVKSNVVNVTIQTTTPSLYTCYYTDGVSYTSSSPCPSTELTDPNATYQVIFTETGLSGGILWSMQIAGSMYTATSPSAITANLPAGSYSYTVNSSVYGTNYNPSPTSGSFTVTESGYSGTITFVPAGYPLTVSESGLPSGTTWGMYIGLTEYKATAPNPITVYLPAGTYTPVIEPVIYSGTPYEPTSTPGDSYTFTVVLPTSSSFDVSFTPLSKSTFTITESGLPSGATWSVTFINSKTYSATSPNSIGISLYEGIYDIAVTSVTYNGVTYNPGQSIYTFNTGFVSALNISYSSSTPPPISTYGFVCAGGYYRCYEGAGTMTLAQCESNPGIGNPCGTNKLSLLTGGV